MQFPGAWPDSPLIDHPSDSPRERVASPSCSAVHRPAPLRIIVPPSEHCPFSTDLTLPISPLSLPTPVSSSCFTFSDAQEPADAVLPPPALVLPSSPATDVTSPTSSQFLLMPPTPHLEIVGSDPTICVSPTTESEPIHDGPDVLKPGNRRPRQLSSPTWLSDLGGHTETDRMFHHNFLDGSPASTPAPTPSALSPCSHVSSNPVHNLQPSLAKSAVSSPNVSTLSPQLSSPARLALKPTGTDTFPSTLDGLEAWLESVPPGAPRSEEACSPLTEDVHDAPSEELASEPVAYPSMTLQQHSHHLSPRMPRVSRSQTFIKRAKMIGGRVKQLVTRHRANKYYSSMDRGVSFSVVTSQDSDHGSVILITAPPPPYDARALTLAPHGPPGQEHVRSRTVSEYSSAVQTNSVGGATTSMAGSISRRVSGNRNTFRRLSLAALSTMKRL